MGIVIRLSTTLFQLNIILKSNNCSHKAFIDEHLAGSCKFEQVTPCVRQYRSNVETGVEIAIIKQFTFSSALLRMSVLCKTLYSENLHVYTKGAPEKILELCRPETSEYFFELKI